MVFVWRRDLSKKNISSLPEDIYALFNEDEHHEPSEENIHTLGENIKDLVRTRLSLRDRERGPLRFSNLGRPPRQLWYEANRPELKEPLRPEIYFKFLYGDVIEQLLMFLAKEAGHAVTDEQRTLTVDGVDGHIDGIIDGVTVDAKSASPYGYRKFADKSLFEDDSFGYIGQLGAYAATCTPDTGGAFLAADKVGGDICILPISPELAQQHEPVAKIELLRSIIAQPEPPERCYPDKPEGKSGNRILGTNCSYCGFKEECWKDTNGGYGLRKFIYSKGPVWFTRVEKVPMVHEILKDNVYATNGDELGSNWDVPEVEADEEV